MPTSGQNLLCRYQYDPLDRLTVCTLAVATGIERFYLKDRRVTEIEGQTRRSVVHHEDGLLAYVERDQGAVDVLLLASNQQRSVLSALGALQPISFAYAPYGYRSLDCGLPGLPGFNGEEPDRITGHYLFGNGYRAFNPVLMRFNSPDDLSPFDKGGINAYVYCGGDPANREDRTGHTWKFVKPLLRAIGVMRKSQGKKVNTPENPKSVQDPQTQNRAVGRTTNSDLTSSHSSSNSVSEQSRALLPTPGVNAPYDAKTAPYAVRVVNINREVIRMAPINQEAHSRVRITARANQNVRIDLQSAIVRGIGRLEDLPEGMYYIFPNVSGR